VFQVQRRTVQRRTRAHLLLSAAGAGATTRLDGHRQAHVRSKDVVYKSSTAQESNQSDSVHSEDLRHCHFEVETLFDRFKRLDLYRMNGVLTVG